MPAAMAVGRVRRANGRCISIDLLEVQGTEQLPHFSLPILVHILRGF